MGYSMVTSGTAAHNEFFSPPYERKRADNVSRNPSAKNRAAGISKHVGSSATFCYLLPQPPGGQMGVKAWAAGTPVLDSSISAAARISNVFFTMKLLIEVGVAP
jgi:hypothetical protein